MSDQREVKNSIFNPNMPAGVDPRMPMQSVADKLKAEFGLDIPTELVPLPSCGKVYPPEMSLHNQDVVEIRPMTAREEDILTSRALIKKGTVITELIKACLVDRSINTSDLLVGDRNALMMAIRITGYGPDYTTEMDCDECSSKNQQTFNLSDLPIKKLEIDPVIQGQNIFEFLLPRTKKKVRFKFSTGRDEEEASILAEKQKKLGLGAETGVTTSLMQSILSIDGIEDRVKISNFIKFMPAQDSLALRNYMREHEPGVLMKQETVCPACGNTEEVNMPLGINFLWPSSRR
jgi:hypothetical protein